MTDKQVLQPGPDHPITVEPTEGRVSVTLGGRVVADSHASLTLREAGYPPMQYVPIADVDAEVLSPSEHTTYCPYKGEATYYSLAAGDAQSPDSVWTYQAPYDAVAEVRDHVSFYADRVDAITVEPAG